MTSTKEKMVATWTLKQASFQIVSGGSAGFVEICMMHPLDLVKTRFQIQSVGSASDPNHYVSLADCFKKLYANEGFLSFWKGVLPPILVETPKRAVKFLVFESVKPFFLFDSPTPTPITFTLAGLAAGVFEGIIVNPFEVVKVKLQSNRQILSQAPSTWSVTKDIIRTEGFGFRGINKGVTATMFRNGIFNMVYFGCYHTVKGIVPEAKDTRLEVMRRLLIGFVTGCFGCVLNTPFDVAKSRIQGPQPIPGQIKYRGTLKSVRTIYLEEGFFALYKGFTPKVMRLGPGGAIVMVGYEYVYDFLKKTFPG